LITEELELQLHEIHVYQVISDEGNPGIVKLHDVFEDANQILLVLEYINGCNLFSWIKQYKQPIEAVTKVLFCKIVKIVQFLHHRGIVHRDIKLENIMMT
jgi:serine/threonine protein kinase